MTFDYYGSQHQDIHAEHKLYFGIDTPRQLYDALKSAWCIETCSPGLRPDWSEDNPTLGQCSITALLCQDIFGGQVYGMHLPGGAIHCYNVVDGRCLDLTSEQFGERARDLSYRGNVFIDRDDQFKDESKRERYELLKSRLKAALQT